MFRKKKTIRDSLIEVGVDVSKPIGAYILKKLIDLEFLDYVKLIINIDLVGDTWIYLREIAYGRAVAIVRKNPLPYDIWVSCEPGNSISGMGYVVKSMYDIYGNPV